MTCYAGDSLSCYTSWIKHIANYISKAPLRERDEQTADTEFFMKICGTSQRDHGFSFFIDNLLVPHHAFGKGKQKRIWNGMLEGESQPRNTRRGCSLRGDDGHLVPGLRDVMVHHRRA